MIKRILSTFFISDDGLLSEGVAVVEAVALAEGAAFVEDPHWVFMILIPFLSGKFGVVIDNCI